MDLTDRPVWPEDDPYGLKWALFGPYDIAQDHDRGWRIPSRLRQVIGEDWRLVPPEGAPLHPSKISRLESSLLRDIQFVRKLRSGQFGAAYEITAEALVSVKHQDWRRNRFAIKVTRLRTPDKDQIKVALSDMHALRYLRHKNICNMFDIIGIPDRTTGYPYAVVCLVMELCDRDLMSFVNQLRRNGWKLNDQFNRHWFAQIVLGLAYIHRMGFIHYDIHSGNILIMYNDLSLEDLQDRFMSSVIKLGDFGRALDKSKLSPQDLKDTQLKEIFSLGICLDRYHIDYKSPLLKKLTDQLMGSNPPTTQEVLSDDWLQANTDPRTERFIRRPTRYREPRFDHLTQRWLFV